MTDQLLAGVESQRPVFAAASAVRFIPLTAIALACCWLTWITKENFDAHL